MKLIVGLGNPGKEYEKTRHNIGFDVLELFSHRNKLSLWKNFMNSEISTVMNNGEKIIFAKPQTYMNNSGESIVDIAKYYKIEPEDIWVICDDLDLPVGKVRIRKKGSAGGHNGLKSIMAHLQSENFCRFRVGIGHPKNGHTVIEHVLGRPYGEDIKKIEEAEEKVAKSIEFALKENIDKAMNYFNDKKNK